MKRTSIEYIVSVRDDVVFFFFLFVLLSSSCSPLVSHQLLLVCVPFCATRLFVCLFFFSFFLFFFFSFFLFFFFFLCFFFFSSLHCMTMCFDVEEGVFFLLFSQFDAPVSFLCDTGVCPAGCSECGCQRGATGA